jgi:hypothetical protein
MDASGMVGSGWMRPCHGRGVFEGAPPRPHASQPARFQGDTRATTIAGGLLALTLAGGLAARPTGVVANTDPSSAPGEPTLEEVRRASERFRDVRVALAEGYIRDPNNLCEDDRRY